MYLRKPLYAVASALALYGCRSTSIVSTPVDRIDNVPLKVADLTDDQLKNWFHSDLLTDTIPGMSVDKAYTLLKGKKGSKIIVGVIDSGIDINHEDLKNVIWTNPNEIPGNGIDDDKNGYVDDIHGWNFLGDINHETLEMTRIVRGGDTSNPDYASAKAAFDEKYNEAMSTKTRYEQLLQMLHQSDAAIKKETGKETYTKAEVEAIEAKDESMQQFKGFILQMFSYADSISEIENDLKDGIKHFAGQLNYNLNLEYNGRKILGDNENDLSDAPHGNNNVIGPDLEQSLHGTHVAGIIAAQRNNGVGMNGVAHNVEIMALRAVPDGDEYDKDIALAIRYAADNGAKVINTSFGKDYSPHSQWVRDAIIYAASKDVLIINAAGNDSKDLDKNNVFPNDQLNNGPEIADNFVTVGALNVKYGPSMVARFSNYGKINVDVFAPGVKIWATAPNNEYRFLQGTSMASPAVAGVAALIRSYYPKLTASQVKKVLIQSGLTPNTNVTVGDPQTTKPFAEISKSGTIVNAYNALILAERMAKGK